MAECSINTLLSSAKCLTCLTPAQLQVLELQLLCDIYRQASETEGPCPVNDLLAESACLSCLTPAQLEVVELQLLCDIYRAESETTGDCTIDDLLADGECLTCLTSAQLQILIVQLLCNIHAAGATPPTPPVPCWFDCDTWQDFEFDVLNAANCNLHDHNPLVHGWTVNTAGGNLTTNALGERTTLCRPQNLWDTGARGLRYNYGPGVAGYVLQAFSGVGVAQTSVGFWFKMPTIVGNAAVMMISFRSSAGVGRMTIETTHLGGVHQLRCFTAATGYVYININPDTWYWLTAKYVQNGTNLISVYNEDGTALVTNVALTEGSNSNCGQILFGPSAVFFSEAVIFYYDDLCIDYTDATFPLGP